jgi:hypothetical protein
VTSKFTELAIDCADPSGLARFWGKTGSTSTSTRLTESKAKRPVACSI